MAGVSRAATGYLRKTAPCSLRPMMTTTSASTTLPVPSFADVKFQKEDVGQVMTELPSFNFYEMKESLPNPYQGTTLDQSILLSPPEPALVPPEMKFSRLENGLKIASIDNQGLTSHLGLFVGAGSRFETSANFGVSNMVSAMAFKSTAHLSHLRTAKTLEQLGANASSSCTAGREEIVYHVDVMREFAPLVIPLMIGNVLFPRLLPWEVKAAHAQVKEARLMLQNNADNMVSEMLHKAAFCNNTLGLSPFASERSMSYFTPETIRSFMLDHFAPERMVLVGVNVEHDALSKWAMRSFVDYNAIPMKPRSEAKATYTGGDLRLEGSSPFCHLALGLESIPFGQKELAPVSLLQTILGSGAATTTGLGSGVLSRLSTQVVRQNPFVESCAAFNTSYSDSGIFGVYGVVHPEKAGELAGALTKTLKSLTEVSEDELLRAKSMLKGRLFRQADHGVKLMEDIGQQLLLSNTFGSAGDFATIIDSVTTGELVDAAKRMLSSKPTVVAFGDTHTVPHYSAIEEALQ